MLKHWAGVLSLGAILAPAYGASRLDGTTFQASIYNLPDSLGVVRYVGDVVIGGETIHSNCDGGTPTPVGNDGPPVGCVSHDSGGSPVTLTMNGGEQSVGGLKVTPTATEFPGKEIVVDHPQAGGMILDGWSAPGDIVQFRLNSDQGAFGFIQGNPSDFWGFSATGVHYPDAAATAEVGFREEAVQPAPINNGYSNFYFWFEKSGVPASGYALIPGFQNLPLMVGQHPLNPNMEVVYIGYDGDDMDQLTDTVQGGWLDVYSHGSDLDKDPTVGNLANLAGVVGLGSSPEELLQYNGFGIGLLVTPPAVGNPCDLNGDGAVDAADAGIMFGDWGGPDAPPLADKNHDGFVDAADAGIIFAAWTGDPTAPGSNASTAEYNSDTGELKISSNGAVNVFVQSASGKITPLSPPPSVPVGLLTNNASRVGITNLGPINLTNYSFGSIGSGLAASDLKLVYTPALGQKGIEIAAGSAGFAYVPEPTSCCLLGFGLLGLLAGRPTIR